MLPNGFGDGVGAISSAQFLLGLFGVGPHGLLAQFEVFCDFLEGRAEGDQPQNCELTWGQARIDTLGSRANKLVKSHGGKAGRSVDDYADRGCQRFG